jgi:ionotropic kainate glutamate receptor 2
MNPLAVEIWLFLLLAYVLVSLSMWVVARFTPYEWHHTEEDQQPRCHCNNHHQHQHRYGQEEHYFQQQQQQQRLSLCDRELTAAAADLIHQHHQQRDNITFKEPVVVLARSNDFSLANSFWFTIGTLMQQGSDLNPKVLPALFFFYFVVFSH